MERLEYVRSINVLGCNSHGILVLRSDFCSRHFFPRAVWLLKSAKHRWCPGRRTMADKAARTPVFLSRSFLALPRQRCHFLIHLCSLRPCFGGYVFGKTPKHDMCLIHIWTCIYIVRFQAQPSKLRLKPLRLPLKPMTRCWRSEVYCRCVSILSRWCLCKYAKLPTSG